jgi:heavy metal efflux system protein
MLVPGLAFLAYRHPRRVFRNHVLEWLEAGYRRTSHRSLRRPSVVYTASALAAVDVIALGATVSREFRPELDEGSIWLHAEMAGGISLAKAMEMDDELRKVVMEFPEVDNVVTYVGRNDDGTDPWTPSHVEAGVTLRPYSSWPSGGSRISFAAWRGVLANCPATRSPSAADYRRREGLCV